MVEWREERISCDQVGEASSNLLVHPSRKAFLSISEHRVGSESDDARAWVVLGFFSCSDLGRGPLSVRISSMKSKVLSVEDDEPVQWLRYLPSQAYSTSKKVSRSLADRPRPRDH